MCLNTLFGLKLFVYTKNFFVILPPRFSDKVNQKGHVDELNQSKLFMVFKGKNEDTGFLDVKFIEEANDPNESDVDSDEEFQALLKPKQNKRAAPKNKTTEIYSDTDDVDDEDDHPPKKKKPAPKNKAAAKQKKKMI